MRESLTSRRLRATEIVRRLEDEYPSVKIALDFETPFQLLVATILAAQCTDARVNMITPDLFRRYPTPASFLEGPVEELEGMIFQTGFFRQKAKSVRGTCAILVRDYGGEVPSTMDDLLRLPGVGRKTANVILGNCYGVPGIVVDTHVKRISNLLKLVREDDPDRIEAGLMKVVAKDKWIVFGHLIATHGRTTCIARRPRCAECVISDLCPSSTAGAGS